MTAEWPRIDAGNMDLKVVSAEAWAAIEKINNPPFLFRSGPIPLRLERNEEGVAVSRQLYPYKLRHELARAADFYKATQTEVKPALPPMHVVKDMLAWPELPLPPLDRIVSTPVFSEAGSLQTAKGYHLESRTFLDPTKGFLLRNISSAPTKQETQTAVDLIVTELLGDFPFAGEAERAHAVAFFLLPFARDFIKGPTPLHLIEAPSPGTGKGLLVEVLAFPSLGRSAPIMTEGGTEEEWRKRITAKLITKPSIVLIDNLQQRLDSPALAGVLTSTVWDDRVLGGSVIASLAVKCAWVATGNNPTLSHEITRRTVRIRLDADVDRPWLRNGFRHSDLREWAATFRSDLVWAGLTIVQSWLAVGRPLWTERTLGMFDSWTKIMGGILATCGIQGFLGNLESFYDVADMEGASLRMLIKKWWERFQGDPVGVPDLYDLNDFLDQPIDLGKGNDRSRRTRLGYELAKLRDRRFENIRVTEAGEKNGGKRWKLVLVENGSTKNEPTEPSELFSSPDQNANSDNKIHSRPDLGSEGSLGSLKADGAIDERGIQ